MPFTSMVTFCSAAMPVTAISCSKIIIIKIDLLNIMILPINHRAIVRFFGTKRQKLVRQTQTPRYLEQFFEPGSLPYNRMPGASNRVSRTKTPALKILNLKSRTGKFPGMRTFPETPPKLRIRQKSPARYSRTPPGMRPARFPGLTHSLTSFDTFY